MLFKVILTILFLDFSQSSWAQKTKDCHTIVGNVVNEMQEWAKYGIRRDGRGVVNFPTKCTPFMNNKSMIPLPKRKAAGVNRERYLGNDCYVYEWDSQHGAFEIYRPNSNNTSFYHAGERSVIHGELADKIDPRRNNDYADTGLPSTKMKDLCNKHKNGKVTPKEMEKLSKYGITC